MEDKKSRNNPIKDLNFEKYLKNSTFYIAVLYVLGYITLNLHLSKYGIFIKELLSLDYLKASILLTIYTGILLLLVHGYNIIIKLRSTKWKLILWLQILCFNVLLPLAFFIIWVFGLNTLFLIFFGKDVSFLSTLHMFKENISLGVALLIYFKLKDSNYKSFDFIREEYMIIFFLFFSIVGYFSLNIYPKIKYEYGGGVIYKKSFVMEENQIDTLNYEIIYENEKLYYVIDSLKVQTLKKEDIKTEIYYRSKLKH